MPARSLKSLVLAVVSSALTATLVAGETFEIPRTDEEIHIDGRLDDTAWERSLVFELNYETDPGENVEPPVRTECRMTYSESHIYYGCHAFDPEPEKIRARYSDRDNSFPTDDVVGLAVDPFNAQNTSFVFDVNPLGVQNDRVYSEINGRSDPSWDALWDSAGRLVDDGFIVEAKIPFSSLRFPRSNGQAQTWGFNFRRYQPREVFRRISIHPFDRNNSCRLCQHSELVGFADVDPGKSLEITPTLVGTRSSELDEDEFPDGELVSSDPDLDPGLFVSWGMTPNLNLSGTINPDFSQVEADVAQLDINEQFALFFPELRPFFLEGASFFDTRIRAVHTRNLADPNWGVKLTGQEGKNGLGVLAVEDAQTNLLLPGPESSDVETIEDESLAGVLRYRRDVGQASTIGVLFTGREANDYSNVVGGVDGKLRLTENDTLQFQYLRSQTEYPLEFGEEFDQPEGSFDDDAIHFSLFHNTRNWELGTFYRDIGADFRADLGFLRRVDSRFFGIRGGYNWYGDPDDWFTRIEVGGGWDRGRRESGDLIDEETEFRVSIQGSRWQSHVSFGGALEKQVYDGVLFDDMVTTWVAGSIRPLAAVAMGLEVSQADAIDFSEVRPGEQTRISPFLLLSPGRHLQTNIFHTFRSLDVDGGTLFEANLTELRLVYQINSRAFVRLITQFTQIDRNPDLYVLDEDDDPIVPTTEELFGQFLFSYRIDARTALYLGYSSGYLDELDSGLIQTGNTLFLKLSYAWQP